MKIITPNGDDSKLSLCLDDDGVTLLAKKQGLLVEVQVPVEDFEEIARRWLDDDFDKEE